MGNLPAVVVHAENIHDTKAGSTPAKQACKGYSSIERFCTGAGYRGTFALDASQALGRGVDISGKIKPHQWEKLSWRWSAERALGWFNHSRRLSKGYEIPPPSNGAVIIISHAHTFLNCL